jgi:(R,R)-butanediol dehydrogenase/meso-butanediol dehydrogenase/diacetyl reductase
MKAAIFHGIGEIEVAEVPIPEPEPGQVQIKVHYCGICGSDLDAYKTGTYEPGLIIGHEYAGEISALGEGVYGWQVGDRVTVNSVVSCGHCHFCHQGRFSLCEDLYMVGVSHNGGCAEYTVAPAEALLRVPDHVPLRHAALTEPLANAIRAVRLSHLKVGDRVLVVGAGPIGLSCITVARLAGARAIYATEVSARRAAAARQLGAVEVFNPLEDNLYTALDRLTEGRGPDIVIIATGVPAAIEEAITLVRKGGQLVFIGLCEHPVMTDFMTVVMNELSIQGSYCGYEEFALALDYLAQGRIDAQAFISHEIALDDIVEKGFKVLVQPGTDAVKILVRPT